MERWWRGCPYSLSSGCWRCFLPHLLVCLLELLEVPAFVQLVVGFLHTVPIIETVYRARSAQQLLRCWPFYSRLPWSPFLPRLLVSASGSVVSAAAVAVSTLVSSVTIITSIWISATFVTLIRVSRGY